MIMTQYSYLNFSFIPLSCPHRCRYQRSRGNAGGAIQRFLLCSVPLPRTSAPGPRQVVLLPDVQVPVLLLLQKLCLHRLPFLVCFLLWLFGHGEFVSLIDFIVICKSEPCIVKSCNWFELIASCYQSQLDVYFWARSLSGCDWLEDSWSIWINCMLLIRQGPDL